MISRRALLGTGAGALALTAAVGVGAATHRLDDIADSIGIKPRPRPVASDETLIAAVAQAQNLVLAKIELTSARHPELANTLAPIAKIGQEHVDAVGGPSGVPSAEAIDSDPARALKALEQTLDGASTARAKDSLRAVSPALARVLSSMSAGLAQASRTIGDIS